MARTPTLPPTEPAMWRKLLARTHPDSGGDHDLFIWTGALRDVVCGSNMFTVAGARGEKPPGPRPGKDDKPRIPYPTGADFEEGTAEALRIAEEMGEFHLYGRLLGMLSDCERMEHYAPQEERGATYKQLAAIGHAARMSGPERSGWYRCAESIPLSDRHAGHILEKLKGT
jgi:hypothetical protein